MQRNKFQRVQLPRQFGLNGENSVLIRSASQLFESDFIQTRKKFSVRTFYEDDRNKTAPHFATISQWDLIKKARSLFEEGLCLIVADQIDPKYCDFRGCISINENIQIIIEIALGPGTVRTVTNDGVIDRRYILNKRTDNTPCSKLNYCIRQCRKTGLKNVIFEFSYYKIPIGWKQENFICWEITDDGTRKNKLFMER